VIDNARNEVYTMKKAAVPSILCAVAVVAGPTAAAPASGHSEEAEESFAEEEFLLRRKRCLNLDRAQIVSTTE
jgi:hypothetical protein